MLYTDPYGLFSVADLPVLPQGVVDASAGFGDTISSGFGLFDTSLTELSREALNVNNSVDQCSAAYSGGRYAGYGLGIGIAGTGLYKGFKLGRELSIGKNFRIAPFGNRTGHPTGRLPHYHRRGIDRKTGETKPGQGIGRHRPLDTRSTDKSFLDRF